MVDGELVGDPLDLKMFEFTNWAFEEGSQDPFSIQTDELPQDYSKVRPPAGSGFDQAGTGEAESVRLAQERAVV